MFKAAAAMFLLIGCGGSNADPDARAPDAAPPDAPANPGFVDPTAVTQANQRNGNTWTGLGGADWTCLNTPSSDQPSTQVISLSGSVLDFQDGTGVGNTSITAFDGIDLVGNDGTATSSNVAGTRGQYQLNVAMLPSGQTRVGFHLANAAYVDTYLLDRYLDPSQSTQTLDLVDYSESTMNALPAFIGVTRDVSTGTVIGTLRDCLGHEVSNAVATVSSTSGDLTQLTGADTYYFAAGSGLPVRHSVRSESDQNGELLVLALPPQSTPAYLQVWGFASDADLASGTLRLLAEVPMPLLANAVIDASCDPKRT